jgi:hypothetical protein
MAPKQKKQPPKPKDPIAKLQEEIPGLKMEEVKLDEVKNRIGQQQQNLVAVSFSKLNSIKFPSKDGTITRESLLNGYTLEQIKVLTTRLVAHNKSSTEIATIINKLLNLSIWSLEGLEPEDQQMILNHFTIPEENQLVVTEAKIIELNNFINILTKIGEAIVAKEPRADTGITELINLALSDLYYKLYLLGVKAEPLLAGDASNFLSADELGDLYSRVLLPEGDTSANLRSNALYNFIKKVNEGNLDELLANTLSRQYAFDMALKLGLGEILDTLLANDLYLQELFSNQVATIPAILYSFMRGDPDICGKFLAPKIWNNFTVVIRIVLIKAIVLRSGTETRETLLEKNYKAIDPDIYINVIKNESEATKTVLKEVLFPIVKNNIIADLKNPAYNDGILAYILQNVVENFSLDEVQGLVRQFNDLNLISLVVCKAIIKSLELGQNRVKIPIYTEKLALFRELVPVLTDKMHSILANPGEASFSEIISALEGLKLLEQEIADNNKTKKPHAAADEKYIEKNLAVLYEKAVQYQRDHSAASSTSTKAESIIQRYQTEQRAAELIAELGVAEKKEKQPNTKQTNKAKQTASNVKAAKKAREEAEAEAEAAAKKAREEAEAEAEAAENIRKKQEYDQVANEKGWLKPGQKLVTNKATSTTNHDHKPNGGGGRALSGKATHNKDITSSKPALTAHSNPHNKSKQPTHSAIGSEDKKDSKNVLQTSAVSDDHKPNSDISASIIASAKETNHSAVHNDEKITKNIKTDLKPASQNGNEPPHIEAKTPKQEVFTENLKEKPGPDLIIPEITFGSFGESSPPQNPDQAKIEQLLKEKQELENRLKLLEDQIGKAESSSEASSIKSHVEERLTHLEQAVFTQANSAAYSAPPSSLTDGATTFFPHPGYNTYGQSCYVISFPDTQGYLYSTPLLQDGYGYSFQDGLGTTHRLYPYNPNPVNQTTYLGPDLPPGGGGGRAPRNTHHKKKSGTPVNKKLSDESFDNKFIVLSEEKFKDFDFTAPYKLKYPKLANPEQAEYETAKQEAENRQNEKVSWLPNIIEAFELPKISIPAYLMFGVLLSANKLPGGFGAHHLPELDV